MSNWEGVRLTRRGKIVAAVAWVTFAWVTAATIPAMWWERL